jgi:hypothetical protein
MADSKLEKEMANVVYKIVALGGNIQMPQAATFTGIAIAPRHVPSALLHAHFDRERSAGHQRRRTR